MSAIGIYASRLKQSAVEFDDVFGSGSGVEFVNVLCNYFQRFAFRLEPFLYLGEGRVRLKNWVIRVTEKL